ncbi:MAG: hypothetical protein WAU34_05075 [Desulfobacterales bacterium]
MSSARRTITAENWIGWVGRWLAVWVAVGSLPPAAAETGRTVIERYIYAETTGSHEIPIEYLIERGAQVVIRVQRSDGIFYNRCEPSGATIEWHYRGKDADVRAHREGRTLVVQGQRQGKTFKKSHPIDEAPWFQPLSYALQPFMQSDRQTLRFWLIRTDNFEPVKLKAVRSGTEEIFVDGRQYSSSRIDVSPSGPLSFVWHGSYWFRQSDAVFLQYAGGHLLSGSEDTVIRIRP